MKSIFSECSVPVDETIGCNRPIFINTIIFHKTRFVNAALANRERRADKFFRPLQRKMALDSSQVQQQHDFLNIISQPN